MEASANSSVASEEPVIPNDIAHSLLEIDSIMSNVLSYLFIPTLGGMRLANKRFCKLCTQAWDDKCPETPKAFESNQELEEAVRMYCKKAPYRLEKVVSKYGYPINHWNVSNVENFSGIFAGESSVNEPLDMWDTSNARHMRRMFSGARNFNQDLSAWNTSNVIDMSAMFQGASKFNGQVNGWNTGSVVDMSQMFERADSFNKSLASWDTGSVQDMTDMFLHAGVFNQDISSWNFGSLWSATRMFFRAHEYNHPLPEALREMGAFEVDDME